MSSSENQGTSENRENTSPGMDYDARSPSSSGQRSSNTNIQSTEQSSCSTGRLKKIPSGPALPLGVADQNITASSSSKTAPSSSHSQDKSHSSKLSANDKKTDAFLNQASSHSQDKSHSSKLSANETKTDAFLNQASNPKEKSGKSSSRSKPPPFKEFPLKTSDLPFTKEKLAESLSLEEACGFLPYIMKTKRGDLRIMEFQLDQVTVELQIALRDAKNICMLLENAPKDTPQDITSARVQAQKLMYLLSTSFRIFEKLDQSGRALKDGIQEYSKQAAEYHSSVDILIEHIMEKILEKCGRIETYV